MKQLTRIILSLVLVACGAMVARADRAPLSSSSLSDFKVIFNDPTCPSGTTCVELGYDGSGNLGAVNFFLPTPLQIPAGQTANCGTNFGTCKVFCPGVSDCDAGDYVTKILFQGQITSGEDLDIGISGLSDFSLDLPTNFECLSQACPNGIIDFAATPEPPTFVLLILGLLFVGIFQRRSLGLFTASRVS